MKMLRRANVRKSYVTARTVRKFASLTLFLILVGGCIFIAEKHYNLRAPSVSIFNPVDVSWDHLRSERWSYTLHHDTRVAHLSFLPKGGVGASMGTRAGGLETVKGITYKWNIKTPTLLEFTDEDGANVYFTFSLSSLAKNSAVITDVSTGEVLSFTRSYQGH